MSLTNQLPQVGLLESEEGFGVEDRPALRGDSHGAEGVVRKRLPVDPFLVSAEDLFTAEGRINLGISAALAVLEGKRD